MIVETSVSSSSKTPFLRILSMLKETADLLVTLLVVRSILPFKIHVFLAAVLVEVLFTAETDDTHVQPPTLFCNCLMANEIMKLTIII